MTPRRPTIADVATLAGVSRATVSQALNGKGRIDPATRARVKEAAATLGYRPSVLAQRLRGGRTRTVALVTALPSPIVGASSHLGFLTDLAVPMAQVLLQDGYSLLLVPPLTGLDQLDLVAADGAVVLDPLPADPTCAALRSRRVAVVTVGGAPDAAADAVVDRGDAGALVMHEHLVSQGARCVGVLLSEERHAGTVAVERSLGALKGEVVVARAHTSDGEEGGYAATRELLARRPEVDAIYAPFDAFAVGAVRALRERGRRVPEDVMVATNYDGRRASLSQPPLTALDLGLPAIARSAAQLLLTVLDGEADAPRRVAAPTPRVIARASTRR